MLIDFQVVVIVVVVIAVSVVACTKYLIVVVVRGAGVVQGVVFGLVGTCGYCKILHYQV